MKFKTPKITESTIKEIAIVAGFISLTHGLWLIQPAVAWVIGGITLLWFGFPGKGAKK